MRALVLGLLASRATAFLAPGSACLSKVRPLSTANTGALGAATIPRLEPGLRIRFETSLDNFAALSFANPADLMNVSGPLFLAPARRSHIGDFLSSASIKLVAYLRRVISATLVVASSLASSNYRSIAKPLAASAAVMGGVIAAPLRASAGVLRKYSNLSPTQRLATTPLFFLTNSNGQPYLQEDVQSGSPEQRIIVYFMSSEDAYDYLDEMAQASGSSPSEFRVMATSMEKVVTKIQAKKQSRKLGRYPVGNIYRIQPSVRQCESAEKLVGGKEEQLASLHIPMFSAKGMAVRRASGEVVTPFYFSLEDLREDWAKLPAAEGQPAKLVVSVHDFTEVMLLSKGVTRASLESDSASGGTVLAADPAAAILSPAIVPPRKEIELLRRYYRNEAGVKNEYGQARLHATLR